jgi:hypothetical protein
MLGLAIARVVAKPLAVRRQHTLSFLIQSRSRGWQERTTFSATHRKMGGDSLSVKRAELRYAELI